MVRGGANAHGHPGTLGVAGLICQELRQVIDQTGTSALFSTSQPVSRTCICGRKLKLTTRVCLES